VLVVVVGFARRAPSDVEPLYRLVFVGSSWPRFESGDLGVVLGSGGSFLRESLVFQPDFVGLLFQQLCELGRVLLGE